jgi:hypothetical protein
MAATWKKVIVSGSSAELANVNVDSALRVSGSVAVSTTAGAIVNQIGSTQATTFLSGSFTGSFTGAHTGSLFGTASQALTASFILGGVAAQVFPFTGSAQFTGSVGITGSLNVSGGISALLQNVSTANVVTYNTTTGVLAYAPFTGLTATSASYAATASYAVQTIAALSQGTGITAFSYNGSSSVNISVSGAAALTTNRHTKWSGAAFVDGNITDTGTSISLTTPVTVNSNLTVTGDLTVAGTASFQNTENVLIADRFLVLASGSTSLTDGGLIIATSTAAGGISGSAFFVDAASTGLYGRFAVAPNVHASASTVTADEYVNTTKISAASNPSNATPPTWGSTTNGVGNMWVNATTSDIYIWA